MSLPDTLDDDLDELDEVAEDEPGEEPVTVPEGIVQLFHVFLDLIEEGVLGAEHLDPDSLERLAVNYYNKHSRYRYVITA